VIHPYQNEEETFNIDDLTIENRLDRVQIYGSVEITRDKAGLEMARELKTLIDSVVAALESEELPSAISVEPPDTTDNPFL
jgi:hypothetical protein